VSVTWTATDGESAIATAGCGPITVTQDTDGVTLTCTASSLGGESVASVSIKRDATPPSVSGTKTPAANSFRAANGFGWHNTAVNIAWTCVDATSGVQSETVTPAGGPITSDGLGQSRTNRCTDAAGNVGTQTVSGINIDRTAPTMLGSFSPAANANGWHKTNVSVGWSCTDALSGILVTATGVAVMSTEGAGQSNFGRCIDRAENTTEVTLGPINIDKTAPTLIGSRVPAANAQGWNNTDVTVAWTCTDAISGVSIAPPQESQVIATEGRDQSRSATCGDLAGNTSDASTGSINIDKTAPSVVGGRSPLANAFGWNNTNVTATWTCDDGLSGVAAASPDNVVSNEGADQSRTGTCADRAGNTSTATVSNISIDRTAPSVTGTPSRAPDRNGWYRMPLGIAWSGNDALSGVASCAPAANYSGPDGANVGVGGTCRDRADNEGTGAFGFKYDATSPVIAFTGNQGSYTVDLTVRIACGATDATSGIDAASTTCPEIDAPAYTFALGSHTLDATATDRAGNVRTESSTFTIEVTYQSLGTLVDLVVSNEGVANSLDQKLVAARNAPTPGARAGQLRAFVQHLEAVRGRWLTSEHTDALIRLAGGL
jgi:hypothetical protein